MLLSMLPTVSFSADYYGCGISKPDFKPSLQLLHVVLRQLFLGIRDKHETWSAGGNAVAAHFRTASDEQTSYFRILAVDFLCNLFVRDIVALVFGDFLLQFVDTCLFPCDFRISPFVDALHYLLGRVVLGLEDCPFGEFELLFADFMPFG